MKQKVKLKDIASYSKGSQINGTELIENGEFDYLNGGINPSGKWNEVNCNADTIAISEGGNSCGYVNYMRKPFWCGAHCYYLYDTVANTKYLYYALKSQQERIMKLRSGACMPNIKKSDLGNFEFIFDDDDKQQKNTTDILNKIERVIELRQKEIFYLDELVKARFVEMFGTLHDNENGFDVVTIDDVCSLIKDGTHQTPQYTEDKESGYKFLSSKNDENELNKEETSQVDETMPSSISGYKVLGQVIIKNLNVEQYILNLPEEEALKSGVVKLYGNSLNGHGNFCIAGHNYEGVFKDLEKVNVGDEIIIKDTRNVEYKYKVTIAPTIGINVRTHIHPLWAPIKYSHIK